MTLFNFVLESLGCCGHNETYTAEDLSYDATLASTTSRLWPVLDQENMAYPPPPSTLSDAGSDAESFFTARSGSESLDDLFSAHPISQREAENVSEYLTENNVNFPLQYNERLVSPSRSGSRHQALDRHGKRLECSAFKHSFVACVSCRVRN